MTWTEHGTRSTYAGRGFSLRNTETGAWLSKDRVRPSVWHTKATAWEVAAYADALVATHRFGVIEGSAP
ncbi:MAG: hypothetical protein GEU83_12190 [Pseudonocardiaceae bacterium]|nr:hypothetical protein [Pseudonocardiaceae bacterium]